MLSCCLQSISEELDDCDREPDKRNKVCLQHKPGRRNGITILLFPSHATYRAPPSLPVWHCSNVYSTYNTQASQIAHLIRDYTHIIVEKQKRSGHQLRKSSGAPPSRGGAPAAIRGRPAAALWEQLTQCMSVCLYTCVYVCTILSSCLSTFKCYKNFAVFFFYNSRVHAFLFDKKIVN